MTLIFFFQAEDGIRYLIVTGVQTCALPISEDQQQQVAQPQAARTLTLRVPQVAQRRELRLGRGAALEQMQQRGDRRRGGIGRAAGRGRGEISVVAGSLKKKNTESEERTCVV